MSRKLIKLIEMKKIKFLMLLFVGLSIFSFTSCSKDDETVIDIRDQYVGNWNRTMTGALTLFSNGQTIGTIPVNDNSTITISKSGTDKLIIDGVTYFVNGTNLSSNPSPLTESSNGVNVVATVISNGTLGSNIINLNENITGTWNATNGTSGNLSGNAIGVLTR
jgi:hypothetical protein